MKKKSWASLKVTPSYFTMEQILRTFNLSSSEGPPGPRAKVVCQRIWRGLGNPLTLDRLREMGGLPNNFALSRSYSHSYVISTIQLFRICELTCHNSPVLIVPCSLWHTKSHVLNQKHNQHTNKTFLSNIFYVSCMFTWTCKYISTSFYNMFLNLNVYKVNSYVWEKFNELVIFIYPS